MVGQRLLIESEGYVIKFPKLGVGRVKQMVPKIIRMKMSAMVVKERLEYQFSCVWRLFFPQEGRNECSEKVDDKGNEKEAVCSHNVKGIQKCL